jgi:SAM-dependent methyltransferase
MIARAPVPDETSVTCPVCGGAAALRSLGFTGYQEPARFDVGACSTCDTAFVHPTAVDPGPLYDLIYAQADRIPGYARYLRYADGVLRSPDPLRYLADSEDMYWAVDRYLAGRDDRDRVRLLEVGSGLGYLTYALARRGYDVKGIDLSAVAVERARQTYGARYEQADVAVLAGRAPERFDVVIMTELIEHVPDPAGMLRVVEGVLSAGGEIVVTSPDKAYFPADRVWETELPPVHLWWFSEASMRFLARRLGFAIRFVDLSDCNRTHYCLPPRERPRPGGRPAVLGADGTVRGCYAESWARKRIRSLSGSLGVTRAVRSLQARLSTSIAGPYRRRPTLCAVFSRA